MGNKLYIGNLPFSTTDESLENLFSQAGDVASVKIITDRETGRSRGFAFVEMMSSAEAQNCIERFNGVDCDGRAITVTEAKPKAAGDSRGSSAGSSFRRF